MKFTLTGLLLLVSIHFSTAQLYISGGNLGGRPPIGFAGSGVTNAANISATFASNVCWFVAGGDRRCVPRVQTVACGNDLLDANGGKLTFYHSLTQANLTLPGAAATNQLYCNTAAFASNDIIVLRSWNGDTYQRLQVTNIVDGNSLMVWPVTGFAAIAGDTLYRQTVAASLSRFTNSVNTNYTAASAVFYGWIDQPLLIDMNYCGSGAIPIVAGDFFPPPAQR